MKIARDTEDFKRIDTLFERVDKSLREAARSFSPWSDPKPGTPTQDALAQRLAASSKALSEELHLEFEGNWADNKAVKTYLTRIGNLKKMLDAYAGAKGWDDLDAVMRKQTTKSKDPWEKYIEYKNDVLGLIRALDSEVEGQFQMGGWRAVLISQGYDDWDDGKIEALKWVLERTEQLVKGAGFTAAARGKVLAYSTKTLPPASGATGANAAYRRGDGTMWVAVGGDPKRILQSMVHETGHKVYYEEMGNVGRRAWEAFYEGNVGKISVDDIIAAWEAFAAQAKPYNFPRTIGAFLGSIKDNFELRMWSEMVASKLGLEDDMDQRGKLKKGKTWALDQLIERRGEVEVFLHPVTAYSATNPSELFAEVFAHYIIYGPSRIPEVTREVFRRAAPGLKVASMVERVARRFMGASRTDAP